MKAILPEGFNLDTHCLTFPPLDYNFDNFNRDHALFILTQITLVPVRNKDIADQMQDSWTPLYSVLLRKVVHSYNDYLVYFEKTGVVNINKKYRPKIFFPDNPTSRVYRFTETYTGCEVVQVNYSKKFGNVLRKKRREEYQSLQKEYGHLTKWLWPSCKLEIDGPKANEFLQLRRQAQIDIPSLRDTRRHPIYGTVEDKDPDVQYKHAQANVNCLLSRDIGCTVDKTVGRMHTVLTNMKGDLRHLVTYAGEQLVSIDITNSQPYLSLMLFNPRVYSSKRRPPLASNEGAGRCKTNLIDIISPSIGKEIRESPLMLLNLAQLSDNEDFKDYQALVSAKASSTGPDIYTYMAKQSEEHFGIKFADRNAVKVGMFEVLFSRNLYAGRTGVKKLFKELFPSVSLLFQQLKENDHTRLPCLLQSIESYIMLKVITKAIAKKHPNIPLFTIHDSITTTARHVDTVKAIMEAELTRIIGLPPKLKIEEWNPDNLDWDKYQLALMEIE
ncbi:hypothetical protein [Spirosoma flavum]|uniref:DNA-directed DNA polymerase family A palm domain-containing protein n=1 Tax=Spirosoma flavum TaxID=2048557 RepID=A0ABW6ARF8_9BACT